MTSEILAKQRGKQAAHAGHQFEQLIEKLFKLEGFETSSVSPRLAADLLLTSGNITTAVEVKLYRSRAPNIRDLERAAFAVLEAKKLGGFDHAMLVTNLRRESLPPEDVWCDGITVIAIDDLAFLAKDDMALLADLSEVDRELSSSLKDFDRPGNLKFEFEDDKFDKFKSPSHRLPSTTLSMPPSPDRKGHTIVADLLAIPKGKGRKTTLPSGKTNSDWRLFEIVCEEALQYIFDGMLSSWQQQAPVASDGGRFDAFAKIIGDDVFSRNLIEDFRSRYILFEFKNYSTKIKPNLIHVTEKYLYPTALRSTAIVISPCGFAVEGASASQGALRDAGKLILDVRKEQLIEMLQEKDMGTSPSLAMEALLDNFLQKIGR